MPTKSCPDCKVLPLCLPPHTTNFSQPLDISLFAPLKSAYPNILRRHTKAKKRGMWKGDSYKLPIGVEKIACTPEDIRSGFWWTGLVRLDFDVVRRGLVFRIRPSTVLHLWLPARVPPSSLIRPLSSLTPGVSIVRPGQSRPQPRIVYDTHSPRPADPQTFLEPYWFFLFFLFIHYSHATYLDHGKMHKLAPDHCPTRWRPFAASHTLRPGGAVLVWTASAGVKVYT